MVWTLKGVSRDFSAFPAFSSLCRRLRATRVSPKPPELRGLGASMVWTWVCGKRSGGGRSLMRTRLCQISLFSRENTGNFRELSPNHTLYTL